MKKTITIPAGESMIGLQGMRASVRGGKAVLDPDGDYQIVQGAGVGVNVVLAGGADTARGDARPPVESKTVESKTVGSKKAAVEKQGDE